MRASEMSTNTITQLSAKSKISDNSVAPKKVEHIKETCSSKRNERTRQGVPLRAPPFKINVKFQALFCSGQVHRHDDIKPSVIVDRLPERRLSWFLEVGSYLA